MPTAILTPRTEPLTLRSRDFAVVMGGGIGFGLGDRWSLDVDARYIGILGDRDDQIGRIGGGVTYRF